VIAAARALGLSEDSLIDRVVNRIAEMVVHDARLEDDDEDGGGRSTKFAELMRRRVARRVDTAIDEIAARNVLPNVAQYVEVLVLQETNRWGERTGKPQTFVEYLVARAESYLTEEVNYEGKTKAETQTRGFSWQGAQTRVAHMVHEHLHHSIKLAMEKALQSANSQIIKGLRETVEIKLAEIAAKLRVEVKT
jgi:hypothetical protein